MIRRHATVVSAAVLVLVYVALFVALDGAGPALRLGGPLIFGVLAAIGVQVLLGRTPAQISDDAYADDARGKVDACLDLVRRIGRAVRDLASPSMRDVTGRIAHVVPELLRRVETTSPTSVYSSASQWEGHLTSLLGVVTTYGDVEQHPTAGRTGRAPPASFRANRFRRCGRDRRRRSYRRGQSSPAGARRSARCADG